MAASGGGAEGGAALVAFPDKASRIRQRPHKGHARSRSKREVHAVGSRGGLRVRRPRGAPSGPSPVLSSGTEGHDWRAWGQPPGTREFSSQACRGAAFSKPSPLPGGCRAWRLRGSRAQPSQLVRAVVWWRWWWWEGENVDLKRFEGSSWGKGGAERRGSCLPSPAIPPLDPCPVQGRGTGRLHWR